MKSDRMEPCQCAGDHKLVCNRPCAAPESGRSVLVQLAVAILALVVFVTVAALVGGCGSDPRDPADPAVRVYEVVMEEWHATEGLRPVDLDFSNECADLDQFKIFVPKPDQYYQFCPLPEGVPGSYSCLRTFLITNKVRSFYYPVAVINAVETPETHVINAAAHELLHQLYVCSHKHADFWHSDARVWDIPGKRPNSVEARAQARLAAEGVVWNEPYPSGD